jgi:Yersinia/Haemophilus virulence surface antigen
VKEIDDRYKKKIVELGGTITAENPDGSFGFSPAADKKAEFDKMEEVVKNAKKKILERLKASGGHLMLGWGDVSKTLDPNFAKEKKRKFGQLTILASRGTMFNGGYHDFRKFICESLYIKVFEPETALLLTFTLDSRAHATAAWKHAGEAHTVAVHCQGPRSWAMFDPNLGVYTFDDRAKLVKAVLALIDIGNRDDKSRPSELVPGGECSLFADQGYEGRKIKPALKEQWDKDRESAACELHMVEKSITDYKEDHKRFVEDQKAAERRAKEEKEGEQQRLDREAETAIRNAKNAHERMNSLVKGGKVADDEIDEYNIRQRTFMLEKNKAVVAWDAARLKRNQGQPAALVEARKIWDKFDSNQYKV